MGYAMAKVAASWCIALLVVQVAYVQSARLLLQERSYDTTTASTTAVDQEAQRFELSDVATENNDDQLSATQSTTPYDYTQSASTTGPESTESVRYNQYNPSEYGPLNGAGTSEDETFQENQGQTEETLFDQGSADEAGSGGQSNYVFNAESDPNPLPYSTAGDEASLFTEETVTPFDTNEDAASFSSNEQGSLMEDQTVGVMDSYSTLPPPAEEFVYSDNP